MKFNSFIVKAVCRTFALSNVKDGLLTSHFPIPALIVHVDDGQDDSLLSPQLFSKSLVLVSSFLRLNLALCQVPTQNSPDPLSILRVLVNMAQQGPRHDQEEILEELPNLAEKIFQIDLLREKILGYRMFEPEGQGRPCLPCVRPLRLVHKSWLETVTKLLEKAEVPFFNFYLHKGNSLIEHVGQEEEKVLNQFVNSVASGSMSTGPIVPAFTLKICAEVFLEENRHSLSGMLVHCGTGLVGLDLDPPSDGGSIKLMFPNFSLPNLRMLNINPDIHQRANNVSYFINNLLNAAPGLTHFLVTRFNSQYDDPQAPLEFQCFNLPSSITTVDLSCYLSTASLDMLIKSDLPNLTSLKLFIPPDATFPDGMLFTILEKVRKTLRNLVMTHWGHFGQLDHVTQLGFPVMEELHSFSNFTMHCQLEPGITSLQTFLPKLSHLILTNNTIGMLERWTENSCFSSVQELRVHLADERFSHDQLEFAVGVNLDLMQRIHRTFPNVRKLQFSVQAEETEGLKYIFMELKQLSELCIDVVGSGGNCDIWDAVLMGASTNFVAELRKSPSLWPNVQLENEKSPSIKNLKELTSLRLENWEDVDGRLISDLAFECALLKMPKLKELTLLGSFVASEIMAERWMHQGGSLIVKDCFW